MERRAYCTSPHVLFENQALLHQGREALLHAEPYAVVDDGLSHRYPLPPLHQNGRNVRTSGAPGSVLDAWNLRLVTWNSPLTTHLPRQHYLSDDAA